MAYEINKTDGTIVANVADGQIDNFSTDITLIGKNYSGFGEAFNENLVKMLENFSGLAAPANSLLGQIWFDQGQGKLKVYNGSGYVPVSSATISNSQPNTLSTGDLWFDDTGKQLYFFDGITAILVAPAYSFTQGLSGLKVSSILDTLNQTKVITALYTNGILLGIFAKDSFTPKLDISGFTGSIQPGFNAGSLAGLKFAVTCTNSEKLGGVAATFYVRTDTSNTINGQLNLTTDLGLIAGAAGQANLFVSGGDVFLLNAADNKKLTLNVRKGINQEDAVVIDPADRTIELFPGFADSVVTTGGSLVVTGDLTVEGTTTTINTANVAIEDKNIIIANVGAPTNVTADGAGITIKGTTDKTILYSNASNLLNISNGINITDPLSGLSIGGSVVINGNSLGSAITSAPGLTSFGTFAQFDIGPSGVTQLRLQNHKISTVSSNFDIELEPNGTGNIALIGLPRITGLQDPISAQDAATREYVDTSLQTRSIALTIDLSDGKSNSYIETEILTRLAPPAEYRVFTYARVLCNLLNNNSQTLDINALPPSVSTTSFRTDLVGGSAPAVTAISFPSANISAAGVTVNRIIKLFQLINVASVLQWQWQSDTSLPP